MEKKVKSEGPGAGQEEGGETGAARPRPDQAAEPGEGPAPLKKHQTHPSLLPTAFFARPAELVAPELLGCWLIRRWSDGRQLEGLIVETEAYSQDEPACHGYRRRSPSNATLFGEPGHFYVYLTYGIHHCVNVVTGRRDWANGVLLRALQLPGEPVRTAAGPALLARRFDLDRSHDGLAVAPASGLWIAPRRDPPAATPLVTQTTRIGISQGQDLPWRWYLRHSPSISRRAPGDRPRAGH